MAVVVVLLSSPDTPAVSDRRAVLRARLALEDILRDFVFHESRCGFRCSLHSFGTALSLRGVGSLLALVCEVAAELRRILLHLVSIVGRGAGLLMEQVAFGA